MVIIFVYSPMLFLHFKHRLLFLLDIFAAINIQWIYTKHLFLEEWEFSVLLFYFRIDIWWKKTNVCTFSNLRGQYIPGKIISAPSAANNLPGL